MHDRCVWSIGGYYQWHRKSEEPCEKVQRRAALAENGNHADLKTIFNSIKRQELKAKSARKFKVSTANHQQPVAPNQKWVGDITYLLTNEG